MPTLSPWEALAKQMIWGQLDFLKGCNILDFGSGDGVTASHFAFDNAVTAVEPSLQMLAGRCTENSYAQIVGSIEQLKDMSSGCFDAVLCHNVLEYVPDRAPILSELLRVLRPGGYLSVVKHNRAGRVMQMAVLLNNFVHANELLDGKDGQAARYGGIIRYYENDDLLRQCPKCSLIALHGIRTFFSLQQNQEIQKSAQWQADMLALEERVSDLEEYRRVAFFHHLILQKEKEG